MPLYIGNINSVAGQVAKAYIGDENGIARQWFASGGGGGGGGDAFTGLIGIFSGAIADIPTSWALCDGTNGTPDLRDKFVVGAGLNYAPGASGGAETHTHTGEADPATIGSNVGDTTLTTGQMPSHTHSFSVSAGSAGANTYVGGTNASGTTATRTTNATGGGGPHTHTLSSTTHSHILDLEEASNLPPYYALAYIMKL